MTRVGPLGRLLRLTVAGAVLATAAVAIEAYTPTTTVDSAAALSYDADRWDAGNIVSDANFYDGYTMSVAEIDDFIESKAPAACSQVKNTSTPCLEDYTGSIRSRSSDANCSAISSASNRSAANIIATVARACGISPEVILVTLQKEQALITSSDPSQWAYDHAMGWGCPDTAPCETTYNGLFNQVYMGAKQFKVYRTSYTSFSYRAGQTTRIAYSPDDACGSKQVTIKNWATAALYNYTPYTPNAGALNNYPGTSNCGSYGNRNFWANYNDWFGSSIAGSSILAWSGGEHAYVIIGDSRYTIRGRDAELLAAYKPLFGSVSTVSRQYVETFTLGGDLTRFIKNPSGVVFIIDDGKRFKVGDGTCTAVKARGWNCGTSVPVIGWDDLAAIPNAGTVNDWVTTTSGRQLVLAGGARHEYVDADAARAEGLSFTGGVRLTDAAVAGIPLGAPYILDGTLFMTTSGSDRYVKAGTRVYRVTGSLHNQIGIRTQFGGTAARTIDSRSLAKIGTIAELPPAFVMGGTDQAAVLTDQGVLAVGDAADWPVDLPSLTAAIIAKLPDAGEASLPLFVTAASSGNQYLVRDDGKQTVTGATERSSLARSLATSSSTYRVPGAVITALPIGDPAYESGIAVRAADSDKIWFLDGDRRLLATTNLVTQTRGSSLVRLAPRDFILERVNGGKMSYGVLCGTQRYIQVGGELRKITAGNASHYPSTFGFLHYDDATCAMLKTTSKTIGRMIATPSGTRYYISAGKKHQLASAAYWRLKATYGGAVEVPTVIAQALPTGSKITK